MYVTIKVKVDLKAEITTVQINSCVTTSKLLWCSKDKQQDAPVMWLMSTWETGMQDRLQEKFRVKPILFYIGLCVYLWNNAFNNMNLNLNLTNFRDVYHKLYYYNIQNYWETHITINWYTNSIVALTADTFK